MLYSKILLGVTGSIAAYKTPELVRQLRQQAEVRVVVTESAKQFVTLPSLQAVSGFPVRDTLWDDAAEAGMNHIALARWADLLLIAPASANCIAQLAHGFATDLLSTLCLASRAPLWIAPAMNTAMWEHPSTQENMGLLKKRGVVCLGPDEGEQACGEFGLGRMQQPEQIIEALSAIPTTTTLVGKKIVITAGPTRENLDPVRYLSNRSSGKMGYALAHAAARMGAHVTLISGPVSLHCPSAVNRISVTTAEEMYHAVEKTAPHCDIFIAAAAVCDFRLSVPATQKIKKKGESLCLSLSTTPDILKQVTALSSPPFTVGFAAETENLVDNALQKKREKKLNMIVVNDVTHTDSGFDVDHNTVTMLSDTKIIAFPRMLKTALAFQLMVLIGAHYESHHSTQNSRRSLETN